MDSEVLFDIEHEQRQLTKRQNVVRVCSRVRNELGALAEELDSYFDGRLLDALDDAVEQVDYVRMIANK